MSVHFLQQATRSKQRPGLFSDTVNEVIVVTEEVSAWVTGSSNWEYVGGVGKIRM